MVAKAPALAFGPAPRPSPRLSEAQAEQLSADTADLGFGRATSTTNVEPAPAPAAVAVVEHLQPPATAPQGRQPVSPRPGAAESKRTSAPVVARPKPVKILADASLKLSVPADLWTAMKVEAAQRRVTVRYLVLEALSKQGFSIDLDAVSEDGRRQR